MDPHVWTPGDACPGCAGTSVLLQRRPTPQEWARFSSPEKPEALPPGVDRASPEQHAELGDLYECATCGYRARVKADGPADTGPAPAAPRAPRTRTRKQKTPKSGDAPPA